MGNALADIFGGGDSKGDEAGEKVKGSKSSKWLSPDGVYYAPCGNTVEQLKPGYYDILNTNSGLVFKLTELKLDDILRFQDSPSIQVVKEIQQFWSKGTRFKDHGLSHKRGILLYGPAGSGKSCTIQLVVNDVVSMGGVALHFSGAGIFKAGLDALREIQPTTPVVVVMEDIESILAQDNKSRVLNVLDGVEGLDRVVFLASTNYPDLLEARIVSRPSRFDRRYLIDYPSPNARREYLRFVTKGALPEELIEKMVQDSDKFSLAHLKEFFVAIYMLETEYSEAHRILRDMVDKTLKGVEKGARGGGVMGFSGE